MGKSLSLAGTLVAAATLFSALLATSSTAEAGCYRLGETGYHWYRYCLGPYWLYPHRRVCRHGLRWLSEPAEGNTWRRNVRRGKPRSGKRSVGSVGVYWVFLFPGFK